MTHDEILHKLAEARAYIQTAQLHGSVLPPHRRDEVLDWADRLLRDLSTELEGAVA